MRRGSVYLISLGENTGNTVFLYGRSAKPHKIRTERLTFPSRLAVWARGFRRSDMQIVCIELFIFARNNELLVPPERCAMFVGDCVMRSECNGIGKRIHRTSGFSFPSSRRIHLVVVWTWLLCAAVVWLV